MSTRCGEWVCEAGGEERWGGDDGGRKEGDGKGDGKCDGGGGG